MLVVGCGLGAPALHAQAATERMINGRVVRPAGEGLAGVSGAWAVLHRVGTDTAGPLDSVRTRANGAYRFRYRPSGDTAAVYFVSTNHGGVAYFTPPLMDTGATPVEGGPAELVVYDTTSAPIPIEVRGRHVIITAPDADDDESRNVVEVYEISNDSTLTRVAGPDGATFEAPLPSGVTQVAMGDGDISMNAIRVVDGRVRISAPLAPGIKQFSFYYRLPVSSEPVAFALERDVPVLEVLVEDPRGTATGAGLVEVSPAVVDQRPFKRFLSQDPTAGAAFSVTAPGDAGRSGLRIMLVVTAIGAAMLLGLGMAFMRKGPAAFARRRDGDPEALALAIAALDARFEAIASPTKEQRAQHFVERAQLKGRLSAALARRDELG